MMLLSAASFSPWLASRLPELIPEPSWRNDANASLPGNIEQIRISGDNHVRFAGSGIGEHPPVGFVTKLEWIHGFGSRHYLIRAQEILDLRYMPGRNSELLRKDFAELLKYDLSDNQLMLRNDNPQDVGAEASCGEGAHQHVGVEEHPHDTSRTTSSSVR